MPQRGIWTRVGHKKSAAHLPVRYWPISNSAVLKLHDREIRALPIQRAAQTPQQAFVAKREWMAERHQVSRRDGRIADQATMGDIRQWPKSLGIRRRSGATSHRGQCVPKAAEANVPVVPPKECRRITGYAAQRTECRHLAPPLAIFRKPSRGPRRNAPQSISTARWGQ